MSDEKEKIAQLRRAMKQLKKRATKETLANGDYCSFCSKKKSEVRRLIAGPSVFICDECIAECNRLLKK